MLTIDQLMAESEKVGEKAASQYGNGDMAATDLEFAACPQDSKNAMAASDILLDEFNSFDYDKDGFLSRDELSKNMKCFAGYTTLQDTKGMVDLYMTVGDRDGDGKIGYIEWNFLKMAGQIDFDPKYGFYPKKNLIGL